MKSYNKRPQQHERFRHQQQLTEIAIRSIPSRRGSRSTDLNFTSISTSIIASIDTIQNQSTSQNSQPTFQTTSIHIYNTVQPKSLETLQSLQIIYPSHYKYHQSIHHAPPLHPKPADNNKRSRTPNNPTNPTTSRDTRSHVTRSNIATFTTRSGWMVRQPYHTHAYILTRPSSQLFITVPAQGNIHRNLTHVDAIVKHGKTQ